MAAVQTLPALLATLQFSVESAIPALPVEAGILPPANGISLLDVKTELLLSYLQNLTFLILVKLRNQHGKVQQTQHGHGDADEATATPNDLTASAVNKLVELRVYLEKGVRPLEGRLKYQIDKVLAAAHNASRSATSKPASKPSRKTKNAHKEHPSRALPTTSSDASDASNSAPSAPGDDSDSSSSSSSSEDEIDELAYRPNPAAFAARPPTSTSKTTSSSKSHPSSTGTATATATGPNTTIYRPPRITPTSLPTTDALEPRTTRTSLKPLRSAAIDDYLLSTSTAPLSESNIGSTITAGGRSTKTAKERAKEDERRNYEEANFTRLPREAVGKRGKGRRGGDGAGVMGEFSLGGLGEAGERVVRATEKRGPGGKRKGGAFRGRGTVDGARGDGLGNGTFASNGGKRRKTRR